MDPVPVLQRLLQFDTVNPPGAERPAQEYLAELLRTAGFAVELAGPDPERPNLVARRRGHAPGPVLGLLSHVDTVGVPDADAWRHGPWSGALTDGCVWGRGALDMKSQTAAEVAAACALAGSGWRPAVGDLVVISVMDEEVDGSGAIWLCEERPDLVRCDYLLNEGDGAIAELEGVRRYGITLGEKGVFRFTLITDGAAGHAATPNLADNALLKLAPLLERLATRETRWDVTAGPAALFARLGIALDGDPGAALAELAARAPDLAPLVEPMLRVTLAPTMVSASRDYNVIPAEARLAVDCRVPPGMDEATALARVREVIGEDGYRLEMTERAPGNASAPASPLMDALEAWLARADPSASGFLPEISTGYSDSVTFRAAFPDLVAYGFFPLRHMAAREAALLVHGRDERVAVRDRALATDCSASVARTLLG